LRIVALKVCGIFQKQDKICEIVTSNFTKFQKWKNKDSEK